MRIDKEKTKEYNKQYRLNNREKIDEMKRKWTAKNIDKVRAIKKKWKLNNKDKLKKYSYKNYRNNGKNQYLKQTYGITQEQYNQMFVSQNGLCTLCNKLETQISRSNEVYKLSVDHNHITGKVRGLLCKNCNLRIGIIGEDINYLIEIIKYLDKHK